MNQYEHAIAYLMGLLQAQDYDVCMHAVRVLREKFGIEARKDGRRDVQIVKFEEYPTKKIESLL